MMQLMPELLLCSSDVRTRMKSNVALVLSAIGHCQARSCAAPQLADC
jgi:hypothetical protein